jgi:hypothetical protein
MTESRENGLVFKTAVVCRNPMEVEIYPATLREQEIPHRTEWAKSGELTILVPEEWESEAKTALEKAAQVFFQESLAGDADRKPAPERSESPADPGDAYDDEGQLEFGSLFNRDGLPSSDETKIRAIWPAWALAALPGTGLGHLYAGKFQMFLYLAFLSVLGLLFFEYTDSYFSFLLNLFSWVMDLGFAAYHIKEHNRRARRSRKAAEEAERKFLDSL